MKRKTVIIAVGVVNTLCLLGYLIWLAGFGRTRLLYTQEGVVYLLPCLPVFVVYALLFYKPGDHDDLND